MTDTLASALVAAQAAMPKVEPDAVNPHFKSKFVSLDHLIAKTRPVLNKHGLAIVQSPTHIDGAAALRTTIYHAASAESVSDVMPLVLGKQDMQGLGGALTYARRYAWAAVLGVCADEDDDGNQASAQPASQQKVSAEKKTTGTADAAKRLATLADEYKAVFPDFDADAAKKSGEGKDVEWLERAAKRLEDNIAAKKGEAVVAEKFPIPTGAKAA